MDKLKQAQIDRLKWLRRQREYELDEAIAKALEKETN